MASKKVPQRALLDTDPAVKRQVKALAKRNNVPVKAMSSFLIKHSISLVNAGKLEFTQGLTETTTP